MQANVRVLGSSEVVLVSRNGNEVGPLDAPGFKFTPTGLKIAEGVTFQQWQDYGRKLQLAEKGIQWALGDWILHGETHFKDRAKEAAALTGLQLKTLQNYATVSKSIEQSRRRDCVDYSTHVEVASLPEEEQERILADVEVNPATVKQVRREVHKSQRRLGKKQSEIELLHTPEVQEYLQGYIETLQRLENEVPPTAKFLLNMVQSHTAQAFWQKSRTIQDDCEIIRKVVKDSEAISGDDLFIWLNEHGYFMSDPELEERLEYMMRDDVRMVSETDAGPDGKQDDRRGQLPQLLVPYFRKWDQGAKREWDDDDEL